MSSAIDEIVVGLVADILEFSPKDKDSIVVANLGTYIHKGIKTTRDFTTVLISEERIPKIKASNVHGLKKTEQLISTWSSGNHIHIAPDQNIPKTYKLNQRSVSDLIIWDDLTRPIYNVIENKPTSLYSFPDYSEAYVKISSEYLIDFLQKKEKAAIQIFQERRIIPITDEVERLLETKEYYIGHFKQYEVRLQKHASKQNFLQLEVNGFRVLYESSKLKQSSTLVKEHGHYWKGIDELVTNTKARHYFPFQYAYVSDEVLGRYESDDDYEVYPDSGSVYYRNQWCVSYCDRVGRNAIRVELKKLYEGTPDDVIDYWNSFSIDPDSINKNEENIAALSERLLRKYLLFGRLFTQLVNKSTNDNLHPVEIISFDESEILKVGILLYPTFKPLTYHVNLESFSKDQFIQRCKNINKILVESLSERSLRTIVTKIGFPTEITSPMRSLKLLNLAVRYFYVANDTGLSPLNDKSEILVRLNDYKHVNMFSELFAINDIRQLDAHKAGQSAKQKLDNALESLGIAKSGISNSYARACDLVYLTLDEMFINVNNLLIKAFDSRS
ncbi:MAG: hypothetical protein J0L67_08495 [Cytophagales bacterium]|nr:hypothetical protein [Cytophagales bacterium]